MKALQEKHTEQEKENQKKDRELAELKAKLEVAVQSSSKRKKSSSRRSVYCPEVNESYSKVVVNVVKDRLSRTVCFLQNDDQLAQACLQVMKQLDEESGQGGRKLLDEALSDEDQEIGPFVKTWGKVVLKAVNDGRNDVQSALKNAYCKRRNEQKKVMPTPAQLAKVVLRDPEYLAFDPDEPDKNAEGREYFAWYHSQLLMAAAKKTDWGANIRNHGTISGHHPPDNPDYKYITPTHEAIVLAMYENCGQRFPYMAEVEAVSGSVDKKHEK